MLRQHRRFNCYIRNETLQANAAQTESLKCNLCGNERLMAETFKRSSVTVPKMLGARRVLLVVLTKTSLRENSPFPSLTGWELGALVGAHSQGSHMQVIMRTIIELITRMLRGGSGAPSSRRRARSSSCANRILDASLNYDV